MKTKSELKRYKSGKYEYIYVYYKLRDGIIRINTGNEYIKSYCNKDLYYNDKMPEYKKLNQRTQRLVEKVDNYIFTAFQKSFPKVTQDECKEHIEGLHWNPETKKLENIERKERQRRIAENRTLLDYYDDFLRYKQTELNNSPSLKDYGSLKNALEDYQTHIKKKLTFEMINDRDFFNLFRNYLGTKHKGGKSKGDLNNNTVHKRFSSLKTFMRYIEERDIFEFKHTLFDYKVEKFATDYVVLTRDEIRTLENLEIEDKFWQKIIDLFVLNCFMGLRFSDLSTLDKGSFVKDSEGDIYYVKRNEKTNKTIEISITKTPKRILEQYDYKLPHYTNQYFNRELFKIFEHYDLFKEKIKKTEIKDNKVVVKQYLKREMITSHTCRRTFITLLVKANVPNTVIQKATGHTQLSTMSKYVLPNRDKELTKAID